MSSSWNKAVISVILVTVSGIEKAISSAKDVARSDLLEIGCSKKALSESSTNIPSKMHQLAIN